MYQEGAYMRILAECSRQFTVYRKKRSSDILKSSQNKERLVYVFQDLPSLLHIELKTLFEASTYPVGNAKA